MDALIALTLIVVPATIGTGLFLQWKMRSSPRARGGKGEAATLEDRLNRLEQKVDEIGRKL